MPTQIELQQAVEAAFINWQCLENVDRGYDAKACNDALDKYYKVKALYKIWYGK